MLQVAPQPQLQILLLRFKTLSVSSMTDPPRPLPSSPSCASSTTPCVSTPSILAQHALSASHVVYASVFSPLLQLATSRVRTASISPALAVQPPTAVDVARSGRQPTQLFHGSRPGASMEVLAPTPAPNQTSGRPLLARARTKSTT